MTINVAVIGHVSAGKTALCGRLICEYGGDSKDSTTMTGKV